MSNVLKVQIKATSPLHADLTNILYYAMSEPVTTYTVLSDVAQDFVANHLMSTLVTMATRLPESTSITEVRCSLVTPSTVELPSMNVTVPITGLSGTITLASNALEGAAFVVLLSFTGTSAPFSLIGYESIPMRTSNIRFGPVPSNYINNNRILGSLYAPTNAGMVAVRASLLTVFAGVGTAARTLTPVRISHTPATSASGQTFRSRLVEEVIQNPRAYFLRGRFDKALQL